MCGEDWLGGVGGHDVQVGGVVGTVRYGVRWGVVGSGVG